MDKDQVSGKFDQAVGKVKEKAGEVFGNEKLANSGVADQVKGSAKETWGNVKDATNTSSTDRAVNDTTTGTHEARRSVTDSVQNVKNKVNDKIDDYKEEQRTKERA
ncbi:MAG: CsbD family protein [Acidobacteriaceae bacterium]